MKNQPWDKLAATIEEARAHGFTSFYWPSGVDARLKVSVEWNGGLPIISVEDVSSVARVMHVDLTAFAVLRMLEECGQ